MSSKRESRPRYINTLVDIFAGTMGGIAVTFVGHPFDTLKVRLQTQNPDKPIYSGVVDCFRKTVQWEGLSGIYKGVQSPLVGQMFFRAILFLSFFEAKRFLSDDGKIQLTTRHFCAAGGFARGLGALAECPIDLYKTQMQIQIIKSKTIENYKPEFSSISDCVRKSIQFNGIRGPYQGLFPHLLRNIPAGAAHFGTFETLRAWKAKKDNVAVKNLPIMYNLFCGSMGGLAYWSLFFPIDQVKSGVQADSIDKNKRVYKTTLDCFNHLQSQGWRRFYKGFSPCLMRSMPANGTMLFVSSYIAENL